MQMDKNAIKKYAVWARRELIEKVSQKALQYGIEEGKEADPKMESINGVLLSDVEKKQRQALISKIKQDGYKQVIEEVAYTWFNRFIALRFMEVNGYLPSHVRVFTDEAGEFKPQIMSEAIHLDIEGIDLEKIYDLKKDNKDDDLFKYLLILQCNSLSAIFPKMFQKISDYTELLLPDYLLREGSIIEQMVNQNEGIPEGDWKDQVEIIGWLYQYYISERHEEVVKAVGKVTISKEDIPAATQLFTTDWVVKYIVENSLGKLWVSSHPDSNLDSNWNYYLKNDSEIKSCPEELKMLKPEEILVLDPCQGSGHILVYMFDVLIQIYESVGYSARDAAISVVKNNLWGLDIDERASQLAYFSIMMKARQYDRRFFSRAIQPHIYTIEESNNIEKSLLNYFVGDNTALKKSIDTLVVELHDAKEYGSILKVTDVDFDLIHERLKELEEKEVASLFDYQIRNEIEPFINVAEALAKKYHVVATNPPYLNRMNPKLKKYVMDNYYDYSTDLFAVFISRGFDFCKKNGYMGYMTPNVWMFIKSYEKLREYIIQNKSISSLVQMAKGAFFKEAAVDICSFVLKNNLSDSDGIYVRLDGLSGDMEAQEKYFLDAQDISDCSYRFVANQNHFTEIDSWPISYWLSDKTRCAFKECQSLSEITNIKNGIQTGSNEKFVRFWYEVDLTDIGFGLKKHEEIAEYGYSWYPYNKGGEFRRWYGNNYRVVFMKDNGAAIQAYSSNYRLRDPKLYFKESITWSDITSGGFSGRYCGGGFLFDVQGSSAFPSHDIILYILGFLNSSISHNLLQVLNPTLHTQIGDLARLPLVIDEKYKNDIDNNVEKCIEAAKKDWDSFEISWEFKRHPLCCGKNTLSEAYSEFEKEQDSIINEQRKREEQINRDFIEVYGLSKEIDARVDEEDITLTRPNLLVQVKGLISYAVGCMFGRYSLDVDGLTFAGGEWDENSYISYFPDKDGIIPICDDEYFSDDIVSRFVDFIEVVYGHNNLEDNLQFIADVLGGTGAAREVIRNYFINDFYTDHVKMYQKCPIYWMFDSGKKNGFKCLIYMHRYQADTIARIRTDYVHEQQARYRTAIEETEKRIESVAGSDKVKLTKKLNTLKAQDDEIHAYEEKIHHLADQMISIDLDDGVKHNYEIFKDVLAKIK